MPGQSDNRTNGSRVATERQPHHISSIAHLFFDEDEMGEPLSGAISDGEIVVTGFNETRISAFACADLVTGAQLHAATNRAQSIQLVEDTEQSWLAESFLSADVIAAVKTDFVETGSTLRWTHLAAIPDQDLTNLETLAGAQNAVPVGWSMQPSNSRRRVLVACLLEKELGQWGPAFRLGRLTGMLAPDQLEIIIFDNSWEQNSDRPGAGMPSNIVATGGLLEKCRNLTSAVAGACPMTITPLCSRTEGSNSSTRPVLQKLAARLTRDISVDPNS